VKAAAAAVAAKKSTGPKKRKFLRRAAGKIWEDSTLADWADGIHSLYIRRSSLIQKTVLV
jgi:hypothetical protein